MKTSKLANTVYAIAIVSGVLLASNVFAQTTSNPSNTPKIDERQAHQAAKIQQGAAHGSLTPAEQAKLTAQQNKIANHEAKAKADGVVTRAERKKLTHEQNHAARNITKKKHNQQHQ